MNDEQVKQKEQELVARINKLNKKSLRVALYSIDDIKLLEEIVTIGEDSQKVIKA